MPTVLIVNDHELQRLGYRLLLDSEPDLSPVGAAADGAEAVRMANALRPDVVPARPRSRRPRNADRGPLVAAMGANSGTPVLVGAAAFPPAVPWHRSFPLLG
ncbi:response regulator transcription factor [Streptomyces phaeochromogenes]|uniref:response regulator transcription factor n=1 Tax=Streptomyces phaeochromogenes TaxID=1923 RepID=UPI003F4D0EEE